MFSAHLLLFVALAAAPTPAVHAPPTPISSAAAVARYQTALREATQIELLSLAAFPHPSTWKGELFHGWPVHGRIVVRSSPDLQKVQQDLASSLEPRGPDDPIVGCFLPRHAIVVTTPHERIEALIALDCFSAYIFLDHQLVQGIGPLPSLESYLGIRFDAAGIKREPSLRRKGPA